LMAFIKLIVYWDVRSCQSMYLLKVVWKLRFSLDNVLKKNIDVWSWEEARLNLLLFFFQPTFISYISRFHRIIERCKLVFLQIKWWLSTFCNSNLFLHFFEIYAKTMHTHHC
jgi:hypothetical protein